MRLAAPGLVLGALAAGAACTGSAPPEPPVEMPPRDVFERLAANVPTASVRPPLTLDLQSCTFARYTARAASGDMTFVMIHPLRSRCELWLGQLFEPFADLEYCRFPREDLLPIDLAALTPTFRVDDPEHCVFESDVQHPAAPVPENANARAATQAFTSNRDQLD